MNGFGTDFVDPTDPFNTGVAFLHPVQSLDFPTSF